MEDPVGSNNLIKDVDTSHRSIVVSNAFWLGYVYFSIVPVNLDLACCLYMIIAFVQRGEHGYATSVFPLDVDVVATSNVTARTTIGMFVKGCQVILELNWKASTIGVHGVK